VGFYEIFLYFFRFLFLGKGGGLNFLGLVLVGLEVMISGERVCCGL